MGSKRVPTMEGDIEYETVVCDSCELEVAKQNATRYVVGNIQDRHDWGVLKKVEYNFDRDVREGWVCEECAEPGGLVSLTIIPPYSIALNGMQAIFVGGFILGFLLLLLSV